MKQQTEPIVPVSPVSPKKQRTGWGPISAIIVSLVAYFVSQAALVAAIIPVALVNKNTDLEALFNDSPWINLALTGISSVILLAVLWLFLRSRKQSFNDLGFRRIKMVEFGWLGLATISYIVLLAVGMTLASNIPGFNAEQAQDIGYKSVVGWQLGLAFVGLVILPPLAEEMMFRGFLYKGLASHWPKLIAALITSLLFGLVHFQWNVGVDVFILSLVLIALYEKTQNLWMCVFLHAIKNGMAFLALFVFAR